MSAMNSKKYASHAQIIKLSFSSNKVLIDNTWRSVPQLQFKFLPSTEHVLEHVVQTCTRPYSQEEEKAMVELQLKPFYYHKYFFRLQMRFSCLAKSKFKNIKIMFLRTL